MTDLELTKACAEAMGYTVNNAHRINRGDAPSLGVWTEEHGHYYPLHSDVQAMALVKRFKFGVYWSGASWLVNQPILPEAQPRYPAYGDNADLNRAICECVAKIANPEES